MIVLVDATTVSAYKNGIENLSVEQLTDAFVRANAAKAEVDATLAVINAELERRFKLDLAAAYEAEDKQHGTVKLKLQTGHVVKSDVVKKVEYDSEKLLAVAAGMEWSVAQHWFNFKLSMPEAMFKALLPDSELQHAVKDARTVKYSKPKITIEAPKVA